MKKQRKETQKEFKTNCHNCIGSGKPTDAPGLVFNIRACTNTKCQSWQHRKHKLGGQI